MTQSLYGLAGSLIGIFVPVYLLTHGVSLHKVMIYFLLYAVSIFAFTQLAGLLSNRIGLKRLMIAGIIPQTLFLSLLTRYGTVQFSQLLLLALLQGAATALYWLPIHVFFASATTKQETTTQVAAFLAFPQVFSLAAPLLASLIVTWRGFNLLFYVAIATYILAMVPLATVSSYNAHLDFSFRQFRAYFRRYRSYFIAEIFENVGEELDSVIWPLSVYLLLHNVVALGAVGTLLGLGGAFCAYFIGAWLRRITATRMLQIGAITMIALWVLRYGSVPHWEVVLVTGLVGIAQLLIRVPFTAVIYNFAREDNTREFILFREYPVLCARILVYAIGALIAVGPLKNIFWLALLAYAFFLFAPQLRLSDNHWLPNNRAQNTYRPR